MRFWFTITAEGRPTDIRLTNSYPSLGELERLGFIRSGLSALSQWRFAPPVTSAGKPVAVPDVFQEFIYLLHYRPSRHPKLVDETTSWLCSGNMLPALPIKIVGSVPTAAPAASSGDWSASEDSKHVARYTLTLDPSLTRAVKAIGQASIEAHYCVDPQGRLSNLILTSGNSTAQMAALAVLNELHFEARTANKTTVWSCGLHTRVEFGGDAQDQALGSVAASWFNGLGGQPETPEFLSATPPKLQIAIPAGAKLPPEAKIEVRFCISPQGKTYNLHVVEATPPQIFDTAALQTVAGWQFETSRHGVCNVYQSVAFKIPHQGGA